MKVNDESSLFCYKVILVGDSGCGKTALLTRFVDDFFITRFSSTIGVDFKTKTLDVDGKPMKLQFWDTAGQERFRSVVTTYHRSVSGVFLVYDVTNRRSFDNIATWRSIVDEYSPGQCSTIVLIGNKCEMDEDRQVSKVEGQQLAEDQGAVFFETSAKCKMNVDEAFMALARLVKANSENASLKEKEQASDMESSVDKIDPVKTKQKDAKSNCVKCLIL